MLLSITQRTVSFVVYIACIFSLAACETKMHYYCFFAEMGYLLVNFLMVKNANNFYFYILNK